MKKKKKDTAVPEGFFSSILFLFLSLFSFSNVTCIFPFFYKRGTQRNTTQGHRHEHMAEQRNKLSALFNPSTRDLGSTPSLAHL